MNRETRRANLRKLQLPGSSSNDGGDVGANLRKTKSRSATSSISNYFTTPNKLENKPQSPEQTISTTENKNPPSKPKAQKSPNIKINQIEPQASTSSAAAAAAGAAAPADELTKSTRAKRTKLTAFVYKDSKLVPTAPAAARKVPSEDDFEIPPKMVKKAPRVTVKPMKKTKSRPKRQQNIKSAFLRNEQIFSEITAQHCIAENFSPDDMQLALAISKSEAETNGILCPAAAEDVVDLVANKVVPSKDGDAQESIRKKLQKYGFRTASSEDYKTIAASILPGANRRKKSKWANKFTALTLRNPEYQMKKVNERIEAFLHQQCITKPLTASESHMEEYSMNAAFLQNYKVSEIDKIICETKQRDDVQLEDYFVKDLFEVTHVRAGHLLKNWSAIQGRDLSPKPKSSRRLLLEQQLQKVYAELERYFNSCEPINVHDVAATVVSNKTINEKVEKPAANTSNNSPRNSSKNCDELDKLLELIADMPDSNSCLQTEHQENTEIPNSCVLKQTTASPIKEPPDKKLKLNTSLQLDAELQADASCSTNFTTQTATTQRTGTGSNSPDLFADSDVEMDEVEIANATQNAFGITTYENYSSDVVKISAIEQAKMASIKEPLNNSTTSEDFVDLTQAEPEFGTSLKTSLFDCNRNSQQYHDNQNNCTLYSETYEDDASTTTNTLIPLLNVSKSYANDDLNLNSTLTLNSSGKRTAISDITFKELANKYLKPIQNGNTHRKSLSTTQLNESCHRSRRSLNKSLSFTQPFERTARERADLDEILLNSPMKVRSKSHAFSLNITASEINAKNSPFKSASPETSLDLTPNEDDAEDECLLLSDDEINYSIWKAGKTINFREQSAMPIDTKDLSLSTLDSEQEETAATPMKIEIHHDYSFLDLIDANKSCHAEADYAANYGFKRATSSVNFEADVELISSQFLATPTKQANCTPSKRNALARERAEFGILDSYSEEFFPTQSPTFKTPTKLPPQLAVVDDELANASFLQSPGEYAAVPLKRYSTSSQKFNALLQTIKTEQKTTPVDDSDDELDEFDKLVYGSPPKSTAVATKQIVPSGLDRLLNAEISFRDEGTVDYRTPKKLYITPTKKKPNSSHKFGRKPTETFKDEEELQINGRVYCVRLSTTPKPDFTKQSEAELLKQLYNFGIKPLKRKQAVKILEYIYNQTHPVMIDVDQEPEEKPTTSKDSKSRNDCAGQTHAISYQTQPSVVPPAALACSSDKLNLRDCFGAVLMRFSHELCAELCEENEEYVFQTNISKKVPQPLLPLHIAWYNLVCGNPTLHETILMFEPIDLQEIYLFLKGLGLRYDPKDMKIFFDRRCIIFRYDLTAPSGPKQNGTATTANNRHVRKRRNNVVSRKV